MNTYLATAKINSSEKCQNRNLQKPIPDGGLLSYRNQSSDLPSKSMDCFLYDNGLRHERVKVFLKQVFKGTLMQI